MSLFEDKHMHFVLEHYRKGVFNTQKAIEKFKRQNHLIEVKPTHPRRTWIYTLSSIAAVTIIGIILWQYHQYNHETICLTAEKSPVSYTLPDQTVIDLYQGSSLQYQKNKFGKRNRKVQMQGKIYFKVQPNQEKPFEITASNSFVRVLGTEFQISENDQSTEVYVTDGKVSFARTEEMDGLLLTKGMQAHLEKTAAKPVLNPHPDRNSIAWKRGSFIFKDTPIEEVLETLEEYYHISFGYRGDSKSLTGEFDVENPFTITHLIEEALGISIFQR